VASSAGDPAGLPGDAQRHSGVLASPRSEVKTMMHVRDRVELLSSPARATASEALASWVPCTA
jgi:hypothetical protein